MGIYSDGSYGVSKDVMYSFPVAIQNGQWKIAEVPLLAILLGLCTLFLQVSLLAFSIHLINQFSSFIVFQGLSIDDFARAKMDLTAKELCEERDEALKVCEA